MMIDKKTRAMESGVCLVVVLRRNSDFKSRPLKDLYGRAVDERGQSTAQFLEYRG